MSYRNRMLGSPVPDTAPKPPPKSPPKSQSTPKKDITNREYYDGHGAEDETASIKSLSSTDSYVEVDNPATTEAKEKVWEEPSEDEMVQSFVSAQEEVFAKEKVERKEGKKDGGGGGKGEKGEKGGEMGGKK